MFSKFLSEYIHLRSVPGNNAFPVSISAIMQPTDHISTEIKEKIKDVQYLINRTNPLNNVAIILGGHTYQFDGSASN